MAQTIKEKERQEGTTQPPAHDEPIDHLEEELRELEGAGGPRWGLWLAAIVVLAVVGGVYWGVIRKAPTRAPAPVASTGVLIEVKEPRPGRLDVPPTRFAWETILGTHHYLFTLGIDGQETPLVTRSVTSASLTLTPDEAKLLVPGERYVWRVAARLREGKVIGTGQARFELP